MEEDGSAADERFDVDAVVVERKNRCDVWSKLGFSAEAFEKRFCHCCCTSGVGVAVVAARKILVKIYPVTFFSCVFGCSVQGTKSGSVSFG